MALEIVQATLRVGEADLEKAVKDMMASQDGLVIESVRVREDGVEAKGRYEAGWVKVGVELVFAVRAEDGKARVDLKDLKLVGFGVPGMVRGLVMDLVADSLRDIPGVAVDGDTIRIDPAAMGRSQGHEVVAPINAITLMPGKVQVTIG